LVTFATFQRAILALNAVAPADLVLGMFTF
jgi:hypothetical protein